jgi:hypothetical protein
MDHTGGQLSSELSMLLKVCMRTCLFIPPVFNFLDGACMLETHFDKLSHLMHVQHVPLIMPAAGTLHARTGYHFVTNTFDSRNICAACSLFTTSLFAGVHCSLLAYVATLDKTCQLCFISLTTEAPT